MKTKGSMKRALLWNRYSRRASMLDLIMFLWILLLGMQISRFKIFRNYVQQSLLIAKKYIKWRGPAKEDTK